MPQDFIEFLRLAPLGFLIGAYVTLVGAGGGALLVPALLLLMPGESPATVTSISLAVVFFNALSGDVPWLTTAKVSRSTTIHFPRCAVTSSDLRSRDVSDAALRRIMISVLGPN